MLQTLSHQMWDVIVKMVNIAHQSLISMTFSIVAYYLPQMVPGQITRRYVPILVHNDGFLEPFTYIVIPSIATHTEAIHDLEYITKCIVDYSNVKFEMKVKYSLSA